MIDLITAGQLLTAGIKVATVGGSCSVHLITVFKVSSLSDE